MSETQISKSSSTSHGWHSSRESEKWEPFQTGEVML